MTRDTVLTAAGWYSGRHLPLATEPEAWTKVGFTPGKEVRAFVEEFNDLSFNAGPRSKYGWVSLRTDLRSFSSWERGYEWDVDDILECSVRLRTPLGFLGYVSSLIAKILTTPDGECFAAFDQDIQLITPRVADLIDKLLE